jgi:hypothetical protein
MKIFPISNIVLLGEFSLSTAERPRRRAGPAAKFAVSQLLRLKNLRAAARKTCLFSTENSDFQIFAVRPEFFFFLFLTSY